MATLECKVVAATGQRGRTRALHALASLDATITPVAETETAAGVITKLATAMSSLLNNPHPAATSRFLFPKLASHALEIRVAQRAMRLHECAIPGSCCVLCFAGWSMVVGAHLF